MCVITEYDEAETLKAIGEEKYAEGIAEADAKFKAQLDKMVKAGELSEEVAKMILDGVISQDDKI